jgi:hypothetical protein
MFDDLASPRAINRAATPLLYFLPEGREIGHVYTPIA